MDAFTDKRDRTISIEADEEGALAYHDDKKVGEVNTTGMRQDDDRFPAIAPKITFLDVDKEYQRAGTGTEMIRQIFEQTGLLYPADPHLGLGDKNALTEDGMALTQHCQSLGYIRAFQQERPDID